MEETDRRRDSAVLTAYAELERLLLLECDLMDDRALNRYLAKNPINAWTTPNRNFPNPLFTTTANGIALNRTISPESKPDLANSMIELIEAKLWAYFNRPSNSNRPAKSA